ncbi:hypothetical protein ABID99_003472 [Mucilaginibacter sp. OAE612]|uniref:hypothetical protein n=1 Tax=Mucilaginibacter sp. OAE612 TaxID=3156444 RepID=UPI00359E1EEB
MSSAFVKEGESDQGIDITPNMASLLIFLKRENGGPVRELQNRFRDRHQKEVHK